MLPKVYGKTEGKEGVMRLDLADLRLFANTSAMSAFLPGKLAAWMAAHPGIQIDTEERTSADIVSSILAGLA